MKEGGSPWRRALTARLAVAAALALGSCTFPDPFPDYLNADGTELNLIAGLDFTSEANRASLTENPADLPFISEADPLEVPAKWDWSWRGQTGDDFQYMTATVMPGAGPEGGDALLLDIPSLAIDGDFEDTTVGDTSVTGWETPLSREGTTADIAIITTGSYGAINGKTLRIGGLPTEGIALDPQLCINPAVLGRETRSYFLHGLARGGAAYRSSEYAATWDYQSDLEASLASLPVTLGDFNLSDSTLASLSFGSGFRILFGDATFPVTSFLDELRIIRGSFSGGGYSLRLLLRPGDVADSGKHPLIPGKYRLTLQVRKPEGRRLPAETGTSEYANGSLTIELRQRSEPASDGSTVTALRAQATTTPADEWTMITAEGEGFDIFAEDARWPVMEILITPTDPLAPDAGAVLVADPVLCFLSYGE